MTIRTLAAALALAAAGQAHAVAPTVTPDLILYAGGGAEQNNVFQTIATSLFTAGTVDYYTDQADGTAGRSYRAVYGKLANAAGVVPAGSNVLIIYRSLVGRDWSRPASATSGRASWCGRCRSRAEPSSISSGARCSAAHGGPNCAPSPEA